MKLSNLAKRIRKAESLKFVDTPGSKTIRGSTRGSEGDSYHVSLFQKKEFDRETIVVRVIDRETTVTRVIDVAVISTCCQRLDVANGKLNPMEDCQGNSHHTVCYHSLGYLKSKLVERGKNISFYEDILDALNGLNFGGQLTKVVSKQGEGFVWAVVRDSKPKVLDDRGPKILDAETNINLMRGNEDDEGID